MMNIRTFAYISILGWALMATGFGAVPSPEKLLGVDTLAVCTVPDWSKSSASMKRSPAFQFWEDPSMKPFRDKFMSKFKEDVVTPLEKELGVQFADYTGLARGQVTLAITRNGWGEKPDREPALLLLMDAGDQESTLRTRIAELKQKWIDNGKNIQTESIRGVEFSKFNVSAKEWTQSISKAFPNDDPEPDGNEAGETGDEEEEKNPDWFLGQSGSLLVLGNSSDDIEKLLARQSGSTLASLSDNATYAAEAGALFRQSHSYLWVNLNLILNTIIDQLGQSANAQENPLMPAPGQLMSALGLTGLESLAIAYKEMEEGSLITTSVLAPESKRQGLLKVFQLEAKDSSPPSFVPDDVIEFSRLRLNLVQTWNQLEQTLAQAYPPLAGVVTMMLENAGKNEQNPDFDLRKSLIANLGDDIIVYKKAPKTMTLEDFNEPPTLTLISSPRSDELAAAIGALASLMPQGGGVKEREFLGRTIYTMPLPGAMTSEGAPRKSALQYVANGSYVAFATEESILEEFLRTGNSKPLRATPGLARATERVGGMNVGFLTYKNNAASIRLAFEFLRQESGNLANLFKRAGLADRLGMASQDNKFNEWVDFSLLPPFERVSKYFGFSVYGGTLNGQGYKFQYFAPNPRGTSP